MSKMVTKRELEAAIRRIDRRLGLAAVCLVGLDYAVPLDWSDNAGATPIRVVIADDPADAPRHYNPGSPKHTYQTLTYVWVRTREHARRLKKTLDEMLFGQSVRKDLERGWRDCELWIAQMLLGDAARETGIETFDEQGRQHLRQQALREELKEWAGEGGRYDHRHIEAGRDARAGEGEHQRRPGRGRGDRTRDRRGRAGAGRRRR